MSSSPEMSVILATPDRFETIRRTVSWLRAQEVRDRLELVIVAPSREGLELDEAAVEGFFGVQVVETGRAVAPGTSNAMGVRTASAPVVAFCEDHCYPALGWAEALIEAHREPWAAVGPAVVNANPESAISWADFTGYTPWMEHTPAGVRDHLPGHNSSYKRDVLLALGSELEPLLNAETVMHWELRKKGYELYLEPRARTLHFNFSRLTTWLPANFFHGWNFAGERARGGRWGLARRLAYAGAWPLIPFVRVRRGARDLRRSGLPGLVPRILPAMFLGMVASAMGEALGYLLDAGRASERYAYYQFHREQKVSSSDQATMAKTVPVASAEARP